MDFPIFDILIFYKKPKLKIGQKIDEIISDNGHHKYMKSVFIKKIIKEKKQYKVYVSEY